MDKYGELQSWDEGNVSTPNDFMKLVEGNNKVRVFTNPYQFMVHWHENKHIKCAMDSCPLCRIGVKAVYRWYIGVIDRVSNIPRILEISNQIFKGIKNLINDPDWGDVRKYDINIKRGPKGSQPLYTVFGNPNKYNLSTDESKIIASFLEKVDFNKLSQPLTPEEIQDKIDTEKFPF